jgi:alpha-1,6-mannosyltransferase
MGAAASRGSGLRTTVLGLCGVVLTLCVIDWATGVLPTLRVGAHLALYGVAFAAYLGALAASRGLSRRGLLLALGVAFAWRVALVAAPPFNDDINRYVWEGRIQHHGGNPFKWSDRPTVERWAPLRDEVWDGVNHRHMPAIYPPLFQLAARAVTFVDDSVTTMKGFLLLCELAMWGLLAWILRLRRLPPERLLILAWSPLALVEIAGAGHNDVFAILWLVAALLALDLDRPLLSALALGAGTMAKLVPGFVGVAWLRRYRPWHLLAGLAVIAVCVWPYLDAGRTLFFSLSRFARYWRFNETLFTPLALVLDSHTAAVRGGAVLTLLLALLLAWRRADPVTAATAVVAVSFLLSPNVLPWYALWFLPLLVLRDEPAALLFTGTVVLAYLAYPEHQSGDRWRIGWGVRALEYLPCALVFALTHLRRPR